MGDLGYVVSLTFAVDDSEAAKSLALKVLRLSWHLKELEPEATTIAPEGARMSAMHVICGVRLDRDHRCFSPSGHRGDHSWDVRPA